MRCVHTSIHPSISIQAFDRRSRTHRNTEECISYVRLKLEYTSACVLIFLYIFFALVAILCVHQLCSTNDCIERKLRRSTYDRSKIWLCARSLVRQMDAAFIVHRKWIHSVYAVVVVDADAHERAIPCSHAKRQSSFSISSNGSMDCCGRFPRMMQSLTHATNANKRNSKKKTPWHLLVNSCWQLIFKSFDEWNTLVHMKMT